MTRPLLLPMLFPFTVVLCAPRWELVAVAAAWSLLMVPGLLALWFCLDRSSGGSGVVRHPLAALPGRVAAGSLLGLFPFALAGWVAHHAHLTLTTMLVCYAVLTVAGLVLVHRCTRARIHGESLARASTSKSARAAGELADAGSASTRTRELAKAILLCASIAGVVAGLLWSRGFIHTNAFVAIREELGWLRGVAVAPTTVPWWYG
ncbi:MAG TPA: hypothetical protein VIV11_22130, partial [Kofleriaceae bacterium]